MRQPLVSVVIPTYNRPSQLARCLDGLAELAYPQNCFEVIVVDDGGSLDLMPATARHRNQLNLTYGRGAYQYRRLQAWQARATLRLEQLSFYTGLVVYPFRRERPTYALLLCCLLLLAETATGAGFSWQWLRDFGKSRQLASNL